MRLEDARRLFVDLTVKWYVKWKWCYLRQMTSNCITDIITQKDKKDELKAEERIREDDRFW